MQADLREVNFQKRVRDESQCFSNGHGFESLGKPAAGNINLRENHVAEPDLDLEKFAGQTVDRQGRVRYYNIDRSSNSGGILFSIYPAPHPLALAIAYFSGPDKIIGKTLTNILETGNFIKLKFGQFWPVEWGLRGWRSSMVERLICNQQVAGSSPIASSREGHIFQSGEVPEWPKGTGCKPVGIALRRFESSPLHQFPSMSGNSSMARASAFQAEGCGFESRFPLQAFSAHVAQLVEHFLGKEEVHRFDPGRGLHISGQAGGRAPAPALRHTGSPERLLARNENHGIAGKQVIRGLTLFLERRYGQKEV